MEKIEEAGIEVGQPIRVRDKRELSQSISHDVKNIALQLGKLEDTVISVVVPLTIFPKSYCALELSKKDIDSSATFSRNVWDSPRSWIVDVTRNGYRFTRRKRGVYLDRGKNNEETKSKISKS